MTGHRALDTGKLDGNKTIDVFMLSQDPNTAMQEMMQALDALRNVYDEENNALVAADTRRFMSLQEKKIDAAQRYHDSAAQLIERREEFEAIDPVLRKRLREMHSGFSETTQRNIDGIERMNKSVQRLSDRIHKSALKMALRDAPNYRRNGMLTQQDKPVSMGINESA